MPRKKKKTNNNDIITTKTKINSKSSAVIEGREKLIQSTTFNILDVKRSAFRYLDSHKNIISSKFVERKVEKIEYPLQEISVSELRHLRRTGKPGFVLKEDDKYYYARIKYDTHFTISNLPNAHMCSYAPGCCKHLSASLIDGCQMIFDIYSYIENYSWITFGYEFFNVSLGSLTVLKCSNYEKS